MKKPKKITREVYDYFECRNYIEEKYNIDTEDYSDLKKYFNPSERKFRLMKICEDLKIDYKTIEGHTLEENRLLLKYKPKYQDFWGWICEGGGLCNGGTIVLTSEAETTEDWQRTILDLFIKEFGDNQEYLTEW